jgi:hypothetical protein
MAVQNAALVLGVLGCAKQSAADACWRSWQRMQRQPQLVRQQLQTMQTQQLARQERRLMRAAQCVLLSILSPLHNSILLSPPAVCSFDHVLIHTTNYSP